MLWTAFRRAAGGRAAILTARLLLKIPPILRPRSLSLSLSPSRVRLSVPVCPKLPFCIKTAECKERERERERGKDGGLEGRTGPLAEMAARRTNMASRGKECSAVRALEFDGTFPSSYSGRSCWMMIMTEGSGGEGAMTSVRKNAFPFKTVS